MRVVVGNWEALGQDAYDVRHEVFVIEQSVPVELEQDAEDSVCVHAVAYDEQGVAVGTGRLLADGHIGRMAVRARARGQGVGAKLLATLIERAKSDGHSTLALNAQTHATRFYEVFGFVASGPIFLDAGIDHVLMTRELGPV